MKRVISSKLPLSRKSYWFHLFISLFICFSNFFVRIICNHGNAYSEQLDTIFVLVYFLSAFYLALIYLRRLLDIDYSIDELVFPFFVFVYYIYTTNIDYDMSYANFSVNQEVAYRMKDYTVELFCISTALIYLINVGLTPKNNKSLLCTFCRFPDGSINRLIYTAVVVFSYVLVCLFISIFVAINLGRAFDATIALEYTLSSKFLIFTISAVLMFVIYGLRLIYKARN